MGGRRHRILARAEIDAAYDRIKKRGIWPDLEALTFETPLWKDDDATCCPTGGAIRGALRLEGTKRRAADLRVERK